MVLGKERKLELCESDGTRKSKRMLMGIPTQESCIFCTKIDGTLHACATMKLDHNLRQMATELQDAELLARISGGDLIANTIIITCLHKFTHEVNIIKTQSFVDLLAILY